MSPSQAGPLQGPHDAARVGEVGAGGGAPVSAPGQLRDERRQAIQRVRASSSARMAASWPASIERHAARDHAQVQAGAADEDGDPAACRDAARAASARASEVGRRERLVGVDEVQAVVRDARARSAALALAVPMSMPR